MNPVCCVQDGCRVFSLEIKQCREDVPIECLEKFHSNTAECLRRYYFTAETKQQSKQWTEKKEPAPKKAKIVPSAGKIMASVFWDAHVIIFMDYL